MTPCETIVFHGSVTLSLLKMSKTALNYRYLKKVTEGFGTFHVSANCTQQGKGKMSKHETHLGNEAMCFCSPLPQYESKTRPT